MERHPGQDRFTPAGYQCEESVLSRQLADAEAWFLFGLSVLKWIGSSAG